MKLVAAPTSACHDRRRRRRQHDVDHVAPRHRARRASASSHRRPAPCCTALVFSIALAPRRRPAPRSARRPAPSTASSRRGGASRRTPTGPASRRTSSRRACPSRGTRRATRPGGTDPCRQHPDPADDRGDRRDDGRRTSTHERVTSETGEPWVRALWYPVGRGRANFRRPATHDRLGPPHLRPRARRDPHRDRRRVARHGGERRRAAHRRRPRRAHAAARAALQRGRRSARARHGPRARRDARARGARSLARPDRSRRGARRRAPVDPHRPRDRLELASSTSRASIHARLAATRSSTTDGAFTSPTLGVRVDGRRRAARHSKGRAPRAGRGAPATRPRARRRPRPRWPASRSRSSPRAPCCA